MENSSQFFDMLSPVLDKKPESADNRKRSIVKRIVEEVPNEEEITDAQEIIELLSVVMHAVKEMEMELNLSVYVFDTAKWEIGMYKR